MPIGYSALSNDEIKHILERRAGASRAQQPSRYSSLSDDAIKRALKQRTVSVSDKPIIGKTPKERAETVRRAEELSGLGSYGLMGVSTGASVGKGLQLLGKSKQFIGPLFKTIVKAIARRKMGYQAAGEISDIASLIKKFEKGGETVRKAWKAGSKPRVHASGRAPLGKVGGGKKTPATPGRFKSTRRGIEDIKLEDIFKAETTPIKTVAKAPPKQVAKAPPKQVAKSPPKKPKTLAEIRRVMTDAEEAKLYQDIDRVFGTGGKK